MKTCYYRLRGIRFKQESLTYEEFCRTWAIVREFGSLREMASRDGMAGWIDRLIASNALPKLAGIILKRHEPTVLHRWLNRRAARRAGVDLDDYGSILTSSPALGDVVKDFFLLNVSWVEPWFGSPMTSVSVYRKMTPAGLLKALTSLSMALVGATLPDETVLRGSQRSMSSDGTSSGGK